MITPTAPQPGVPLDGCFTMRTTLGAANFTLTARYNARMDRWLMDVADANGNALLTGMPILTGWPIWTRFFNNIPGLPAGAMLAVDLTGAGNDPTEFTFGGNVPLFYVPAS